MYLYTGVTDAFLYQSTSSTGSSRLGALTSQGSRAVAPRTAVTATKVPWGGGGGYGGVKIVKFKIQKRQKCHV